MFTLTDNTADILRRLGDAKERALERMGMQGEGYAKDLVPVDTGALRNTITHKVDPAADEVYIGSNSKYAAYVETGTGEGYDGSLGGAGRPTPWVYQDEKGDWHHTRGQDPQPFLRPAVTDHMGTYRNILKDELENG